MVFLAPRVLVASHIMPLLIPSLSRKSDVGTLDWLLMLDPRGLCRINGNRTDGVTMTSWEMSKQLV